MTPDNKTLAMIKDSLSYDEESGDLRWKKRPLNHFFNKRACEAWNARLAGGIAGGEHNHHRNRYVQVSLYGKVYHAHRICWFLGTGEWPNDVIDHINGDGTDNRLGNLRVVSNHENQKNMPLRSDSSSGVLGVNWNKRRGKWCAYIGVNGRKLHLGLFSNKQDAINARKQADREHGFHPNHGRS